MDHSKFDIMYRLQLMDHLAEATNTQDLSVYLLGGSGCIVGDYIHRKTVDIDIVDINYEARLGKILNILSPYDMIDIECGTIPPLYKDRAKQVGDFKVIKAYVLSPQDIIVSKLGRYNQKDKRDIEVLMKYCTIQDIKGCIDETLSNLPDSIIKEKLKDNIMAFRSDFSV